MVFIILKSLKDESFEVFCYCVELAGAFCYTLSYFGFDLLWDMVFLPTMAAIIVIYIFLPHA